MEILLEIWSLNEPRWPYWKNVLRSRQHCRREFHICAQTSHPGPFARKPIPYMVWGEGKVEDYPFWWNFKSTTELKRVIYDDGPVTKKTQKNQFLFPSAILITINSPSGQNFNPKLVSSDLPTKSSISLPYFLYRTNVSIKLNTMAFCN